MLDKIKEWGGGADTIEFAGKKNSDRNRACRSS